jgi:hypothetical protein
MRGLDHICPSEKDHSFLLLSVTVILILALGGFGYSLRQIFVGVNDMCEAATSRYGGDNVEALMALIESKNASLREKNRAIWALGQIGDKRALPLLRRLDTDEIQAKPYNPDHYIVQYRVEKAIRQIQSRFTLTRWMYRWL